MNEQQKYQKRNLLLFPLGTVGRDAVYALINSFLLTFVLFTRSLNAAQLTAITAIMVAARIFDALNDPIMGSIIEHTHSRFGKFKPWLTIGVLSTSVVIYLFFNTDLHGWSFVCLFGILYFLFSITYTMNDISYWGMIPALGSDANARNQFTSRATLFAGIGSTLASILIPVFSHRKKCHRRKFLYRLWTHRPDHCDFSASVFEHHNLRRTRTPRSSCTKAGTLPLPRNHPDHPAQRSVSLDRSHLFAAADR